MNLWKAMTRGNARIDRWLARAGAKFVADLDGGGKRREPGAKRHMGLRDLLANYRVPDKREKPEGK